MVTGHYATALIAHQRQPGASFWLFLLAANFADFLWLSLALGGVEAPQPASLFAASFKSIVVDMPVSHDLVPSALWAVALAGLGYALTRSGAVALWCGALGVLHEICDLLAGFEHRVLGPGTASVGLNLYGTAPEIGILLDAALGGACVWWFLRARREQHRPLTEATARWLYLLFVGGALAWLPIARIPLGTLLGLNG